MMFSKLILMLNITKRLINNNQIKIKNIIHKLLYPILLLIITIVVFQYSVDIRKPWFGSLSMHEHQWLTASTIKFVKNWYREGPINLKLAMIENPFSIEFDNFRLDGSSETRQPYLSYLPGTIIPIYLWCKLVGHEPTPALVMKYNLLNHFLIAFTLSMTIYFFLHQLKWKRFSSFIISIIPILTELLFPFPLYFHQNVFFSDQAVILPCVLFIFLEVIRGNATNDKQKRIIELLQGLTFFYGLFIDWFFLFVVFVVYIKRLLNKEFGNNLIKIIIKSFWFWLPSFLVVCFFIWQLNSFHAWKYILNTFILRTGYIEKVSLSKLYTLWIVNIRKGFGSISVILIIINIYIFLLSFLGSIIIYIRKIKLDERIKKTISLVGISLVPCVMQVIIFRQHSIIHSFAYLKFSIPVSLVIFVLIPILISLFLKIDLNEINLNGLTLKYRSKKLNIKIPIFLVSWLMLIVLYTTNVHSTYQFLFPNIDNTLAPIGNFIASNSQYEDIIFSTNHSIPYNPPQALSYSMKRVYKVASVEDIYKKVTSINGEYVINIFYINNKRKNDPSDFKNLTQLAYQVKENDQYSLYKIKKADFLKYYSDLNGSNN